MGGLFAGLAGILFANCVFVSPTMFSLAYSAQVIIWVIVGGLGTLVGPVIGCILLQLLTTWAGTLPQLNANLLLGSDPGRGGAAPAEGPSADRPRPCSAAPADDPAARDPTISPCASAASSP